MFLRGDSSTREEHFLDSLEIPKGSIVDEELATQADLVEDHREFSRDKNDR